MSNLNTTYPRAEWSVPECKTLRWDGRSKPWCVIIPVINEGARIQNLLSRMAALNIAATADVIIVDGGSTDGSLDRAVAGDASVRGVLLKTGPGRLSAQLRCGYAFALDQGYDGIVTIDGNDKDDPDAIPAFVAAMVDGVDFVQGSRFVSGGQAENTPLVRDLAIRFLHAPLLSLASGFRWTDTTQGFRAYRRAVLLDPKVAPFRDVFRDYELLAYLSYRVPKLGYRCVELGSVRRYPVGEVPTKIGGLRGNIKLFGTLIRACRGGYDPAK